MTYCPARIAGAAAVAVPFHCLPGMAQPLAAAVAAAMAAATAAGAELVAPYVASPLEDVETMLELADVGATDYLIDLGSGDGRIVITAALRGATAHGVELDRELVAEAERNARAAEVADTVAFVHGDLFEADLSGASVVTLYLMPEVNLRLRPKLLAELAPGTRVVSNSFDMGDWRPDRHVAARASGGILMWIVPARVGGAWALTVDGQALELTIEQRFQDIDVALERDGQALHVLEATLRGQRIAFLAGDGRRRYAFSGRATGSALTGYAQVHDTAGSRVTRWRAVRR